MKRGPALVILLVHIGSIFYKELHHVQVLIYTGLREKGREDIQGREGLKRKGKGKKKKSVGVKSSVQPQFAVYWQQVIPGLRFPHCELAHLKT